MVEPLPTAYAPAERAAPAEMRRQTRAVAHWVEAGAMAAAVPALLMILNEQRQIVYANRRVLELLNLSPEAAMGLRPGEALRCAHAAEAQYGCGTSAFCRTCGAVNAILTAQHGSQDEQECRIITTEGAALDLRVWATPMEVEGRRYIIFAVLDISDEKRRRMLERIFFHDIMNLAVGLRGYGDLLQSGPPDDVGRFHGIIRELAARMIDDIQAQRDLVNAENSEYAVTYSAVKSSALLRETAAACGSLAEAQGCALAIAAGAADADFMSDKILLRRVLGNLVKNAVEASRAGETVTLDCRRDGAFLEFRVHNPAVMPDEVKLQVFQRSFSTKGDGRGLGTYSIKLFTERYLRGAVAFRSLPGEGTTFTARYPLGAPPPAAAES